MTRPGAAGGEPAYRWVIVGASALILAFSMGAVINGATAFVVPMEQAYGWGRGDVALLNFSGILGLAFGGAVMGRVADRRGARPVVLFGSVVLGASYLIASRLTSLESLAPLFFVAGFFGAGAIFPPVMAAVGGWFRAGAGLAIGIASAGQALGQGGAPFAASHLIRAVGIDGAFAAMGAVMLVTLVPLSLLLRPPPDGSAARQAAEAEAADGRPAPNPRMVTAAMSAAVLLCCVCMSVPLMHLVPLMQDRGIAPQDAGRVIFVMLLVAIAGRLAFGRLADAIGALPAYMTATAWMTVLVFGFSRIEALDSFQLYAIVYGFGYAGVMTGVLVSIRALTPPARRASAFGVINMFSWFGHAIGGYMGGAVHDLTGGYGPAYAAAAAAGALNLVIVAGLLRATRRPRPAIA